MGNNKGKQKQKQKGKQDNKPVVINKGPKKKK